jgi:DNA-directed RNA polymerase specialized sigma24 family protein
LIYRTERTTLTATPVLTAQTSPSPEPPEPDPAERSIAAKVFELLTALDPDNRLRKAPPIKVFLLRFRKNLPRAEIARICGCDKSLVALRLKTIRDKLPWEPRQLREMSAHVEAMQDAVSDSRARRIYRKGAVYGEEEDSQQPD